MFQPFSRRSFLQTGAGLGTATALVGAGVPGFRAAAFAAGKDLGPMVFQLPWVKNVEWAGEYFADKKGYYKAEGFSSVNLLPGGPNAALGETVISAGKAFASISSPATTANAILKGAKIKTIGVQYQTSPFIIISLADKPIKTPQDMVGKKIGVPGGNEPTWNAFLKVNNIDSKSLTAVTVGYTPAPLTTKQVDGLMAFVTNTPGPLKREGIETHYFGLGEFNYRLVNNNYIVTDESLAKHRDAVKALLRAEIKGWKDSLASVEESAKITVEEYGKDLGLKIDDQIDQSKVQNTLIVSDETKKLGLFMASPAQVDKCIELLKVSGVEIAAKDLFDLSVLEEIYKEDPSLK
ncbi:MAG TPA: ABC transporter substrate-binding protein [Magnetospirillaceae bacterium]|jgi:ABC-type nitrate/sulfonate/bicarbonate transport system substrate-binding protein